MSLSSFYFLFKYKKHKQLTFKNIYKKYIYYFHERFFYRIITKNNRSNNNIINITLYCCYNTIICFNYIDLYSYWETFICSNKVNIYFKKLD